MYTSAEQRPLADTYGLRQHGSAWLVNVRRPQRYSFVECWKVMQCKLFLQGVALHVEG